MAEALDPQPTRSINRLAEIDRIVRGVSTIRACRFLGSRPMSGYAELRQPVPSLTSRPERALPEVYRSVARIRRGRYKTRALNHRPHVHREAPPSHGETDRSSEASSGPVCLGSRLGGCAAPTSAALGIAVVGGGRLGGDASLPHARSSNSAHGQARPRELRFWRDAWPRRMAQNREGVHVLVERRVARGAETLVTADTIDVDSQRVHPRRHPYGLLIVAGRRALVLVYRKG